MVVDDGLRAIRAPGRVASITLLDPAGLTKLDARFWWWFTISGLASLTPMPLRRHRMEPKFPAILTDDELRAITVPVLLITGARSAMLTPAEARDRASLMPHAQVAIVPGSHGGVNRISELNDRIAAFIQAQATGKQAAQPTPPPATS
jgi:pimeloyl-ACP methyl ester carboxylesterase